MAHAYGNKKAECVIHVAKKNLSSKLFDEQFGHLGPCDDVDRSSPGFLESALENAGEDVVEQLANKAERPKGEIQLTPGGNALHYYCKNHAQEGRKSIEFTERALQNIRPILNDREPINIKRRFIDRKNVKKEKAISYYNRLLRAMHINKTITNNEQDSPEEAIYGISSDAPEHDLVPSLYNSGSDIPRPSVRKAPQAQPSNNEEEMPITMPWEN